MRVLLLLTALLAAAPGPGVDLAARYPATLSGGPDAPPRAWIAGPGDVWNLSSFRLAGPGRLALRTGPARVVFGRDGSNVLFAVVLPEKPGLLAAEGGGPWKVRSAWLRFHPARVGEFFPPETVTGPGDPFALVEARRICGHKLGGSFQAGGLPLVPPRHLSVLDVEGADGKRRFFLRDEREGRVTAVEAFEGRPLPPDASVPLTREESLAAFDETASAFDREYAMFVLRRDVDWEGLRAAYRPLAARARTAREAGTVIAAFLHHLRDLHVAVKVGDAWLPGFSRFRPFNGNAAVTEARVGRLTRDPRGLAVGRTADGIGYLAVRALTDPGLPEAFDAALEKLGDTFGLILDLRANGGGDERIGRRLAGRFAAREHRYSLARFRCGPAHDDLGPPRPRSFSPRGPWRYGSPVIVLQGRRTMSSAESLVLMLSRCPQVTTLGNPTAGSSGNPRVLSLPGMITVLLPRWLDLDPEGKPIDERGVPPDVPVAAKWTAFRSRDPVIEAALARLRRIPEAERRPGRR